MGCQSDAPDIDKVLIKSNYQDYNNLLNEMSKECHLAQKTMNIEEGVVFRILYFPFTGGRGRLLILAHHLTIDGFSINLLVDEIEQALQSVMGISETNKNVSIQPCRYIEEIEKWVVSQEANEDAKKWLAQPWDSIMKFPKGRDGNGEGLLTTIHTLRGVVPLKETQYLKDIARRYNIGLSEVLLAAAVYVISQWSEQKIHGIDIYHHGRDITPFDLDISETVGYVLNTYPVILNCTHINEKSNWIEQMAEQFNYLPKRRFGFDALRYFPNSDHKELQKLPNLNIRYNFRGQMNRLMQRCDSLLELAPNNELYGPNRSQEQNERYLLMLEGDVVEDCLVLGIKFSEDYYKLETIQILIDKTISMLIKKAREKELV